MREPMTNNVVSDVPERTIEQMLEDVAETMRAPMPIGMLLGNVVYLNMWDGKLKFGDVECSVDHPLLKGTPIYEAAMRAMGVEE